MPAQYVAPSKLGLFRIVQHGRRWRSLLEDCELGRHRDLAAALAYLRETWPRARLPVTLERWRYLAESPSSQTRPCANDDGWQLAG